jgi:hypothetical protein
MDRTILVAALLAAGCSVERINADLSTPEGQLFCAINTAGGGTIVAAVVDGAAAGVPGAEPAAVIATGMTQSFVQQACLAAARATGGVSAIPVVPPANAAAAPRVAAVPPTI